MAHIFYITKALTGNLHASFEVVARLTDGGHTVTFGCPWDVEDKVTAQGITYRQLPEVNFDPTLPHPATQGRIKNFVMRLRSLRSRREAAVVALGMDKFKAILDELQPDLVIIDVELHDFILTVMGAPIPCLGLSTWFSLWNRPKIPPITSAITPQHGLRGTRLGMWLAWQQSRAQRLRKVWRKRLLSGFTERASILRLYARQQGVPKRELIEASPFPPPFTYRTLPIISLTAWEMEFPHEPRANLHYVGPMVSVDRKQPAVTHAATARLNAILADKQQHQFKLLYCSTTTMDGAGSDFLTRVIAAVADKPDWQLVVGLGGKREANEFANAPANVHLFDWVPQLDVLKHADGAIIHAGMHTMNECIEFGVPMLVYSGKQFDQNGCAARIGYHQLGINADRDVDDAPTIRRHIDQLFADPSYKQRVMGLREKIYQDRGKLLDVVSQMTRQSV